MGFSSILIFLNILIFIFAVVMMTYSVSFRYLTAIRWLLLLNFCFCIISFCTLNIYSNHNLDAVTLFVRIRFLGLSLLPPTWFVLLNSVYDQWRWVKNKWMILFIFTPGLITSVLTLTPSWADFVVNNISSYIAFGVSSVKFSNGPWFPYHYFWAVFLVLCSLAFSAKVFFASESQVQRKQILALTFGTILAAGIDIYCVLNKSELRWLMLSSGTFIFSQIGIMYALIRYKLLNVSALAMGQLFNGLPDPVIVIDQNGLLCATNQMAIEIFSLSKNLIGKKISLLIPDLKTTPGDYVIKDEKGVSRNFHLVIETINSDLGVNSGKILFFREVTLQKSIEVRLNDNLEFKARLLALIAHDLSGFISSQSVLSMSLFNESADSKNELQNKINLLQDSTFASQGLITNIMTWVKTQGETFKPDCRAFEWNMLINECLEIMDTQIKLKKVNVKFSSQVKPLVVEGDSNMLSSVIRNILANAIRATSEEKNINIQLKTIGENVEVIIEDEGIGMSEEQLNAVRISSARLNLKLDQAQSQSYGIGLSLIRHFISLHNGEFFIDSRLGQGTRVSFYIPFKKPSH